MADDALEATLPIPEGTHRVECWVTGKAQWLTITRDTTGVLASNPGTTGKAVVAPPIAGACVCFDIVSGKWNKHSVSNAAPDVDGARERPGSVLHYKPAETGGASTLYVSFFK